MLVHPAPVSLSCMQFFLDCGHSLYECIALSLFLCTRLVKLEPLGTEHRMSDSLSTCITIKEVVHGAESDIYW